MLGGRWFARALFALEKITYRVVHCVCTISDDMRDRIVSKGVPASKVFVHRNGADDEKVMPASPQTPLRHEWGLEDKLVVLYAGNLGVKQGLHTLLDAAARLAGQREIAFVIVGDGGEKERLVERARRLALANVIFRPLQPPERLRELLATADIAVIPQRGVVRDVVFPTKVAYIMCSARPIVAAVVADGELARVLHQADCGVVVEPENADALAAAIVALARAPEERVRLGRNGRSYAERHLSHRAVFGHFADRIAAPSALGNRRPKRAVAAPAHRNLALTGSDPARTIFPGDEQPCD
jgi:colanic acid biosynthesis glycosyl transferase WcaI